MSTGRRGGSRLPARSTNGDQAAFSAPPARRAFRGDAHLALITLAFALYAHTLRFGLTALDDVDLLVDGGWFLARLGNVVAAFGQGAFFMLRGRESYYRPLLTVSFILDAQSPLGVLGYHLTNVGLHAACGCAVLATLRGLGYRTAPSLLLAAGFVAHPALAPAVAWIPGRNDSLLTLFASRAVAINPHNDEAQERLREARARGTGTTGPQGLGAQIPKGSSLVPVDRVSSEVVTRAYDRALEKDPGNESIRRNYAACCAGKGIDCPRAR